MDADGYEQVVGQKEDDRHQNPNGEQHPLVIQKCLPVIFWPETVDSIGNMNERKNQLRQGDGRGKSTGREADC